MASGSLAELEATLRSIGHGAIGARVAALVALEDGAVPDLETALESAPDGLVLRLADLALHAMVEGPQRGEDSAEPPFAVDTVVQQLWTAALARRGLRTSALAALEAAVAQAVARRDGPVQARLVRLVLGVGALEADTLQRAQRALRPLRPGAGPATATARGVAAAAWAGRSAWTDRERDHWLAMDDGDDGPA